MASALTKIQSVTVGAGGAATVSFTSIPQTYTDLVMKITARSTYSATNGVDNLIYQFNSTTTGYASQGVFQFGASISAGSWSTLTKSVAYGRVGDSGVPMSSAGTTANTFSSSDWYIPNYTWSNPKSWIMDMSAENNSTSNVSAEMDAGYWANNAAITAITLAAYNGDFAQNSTFTLYGVTKYAQTGTGSKAVGGTVTTSGGYTYHTFFSSGMFTPTTNITGAEVLVVAGGGGTSGSVDGGGGAGGLVYASSQSYTSGVNYAAIVGAGGSGGVPGAQKASNGTNSVFAGGTVAIGGGSGNGGLGSNSGGSGGGQGAPGASSVGSGTAGQGNNGGATGSAYGGGGGGAGAVGGTGGANGRGGDGGIGVSTYSAWGAATATGENYAGTYYYAGGGGGSAWNGVSANGIGGQGGLGGGGQGAGSNTSTTSPPYATNGMATTGGGAGGDNGYVYSGGSGIVIVRYTT
jgi:hypothetical protein